MNLTLENINVKYSHKVVLQDVSESFNEGQIHILIGENGAGKSTLTKVICGDIVPDSGKIYINNSIAHIKTPRDAINYGIVCVHQRPLLAESISIKENLLLGLSDFNREKAESLLKTWLPDVKKNTLVRNLGGDERFFTSLIGALLKNPELLILDEPSALLDITQRDFLFEQLKGFARNGMNIIVITHNMDEAKKYSDTITFLEEGKKTEPKDDFLNRENVTDSSIPETICTRETKNCVKLNFENLVCKPVNKPAIFDINFHAESGKLTLVCGAVESGRETLEDLICGMNIAKASGEIQITSDDGRNADFFIKNGNFTRRLMEKSDFVFGIIPSNKNFRGSNPNLTVLQLLTSGVKGSRQELQAYAEKLIKKADINILSKEKASCLSGGMLQRLILERELEKNPDILILCEPVQGLDILSSQKLCRRLRALADSGKVILVLSSSEFPKNICDSVYYLKSGFVQKAEN